MDKKQWFWLYTVVWVGLLISVLVGNFSDKLSLNNIEIGLVVFDVSIIMVITGTMIETFIFIYSKWLRSLIEKSKINKKMWLSFFVLVGCLFPITAYILSTKLLLLIIPILKEQGIFWGSKGPRDKSLVAVENKK